MPYSAYDDYLYEDEDEYDFLEDEEDFDIEEDYDPRSYYDSGLSRQYYRAGQIEGYEPGYDAPEDQDEIEVLDDGSLVFSPYGEKPQRDAYSLAFKAPEEEPPSPIEVTYEPSWEEEDIPGPTLGYTPVDAVEPAQRSYQLTNFNKQVFNYEVPVQDEQNLETSVIPEAVYEQPVVEPVDAVTPIQVPEYEQFSQQAQGAFARYTPDDLVPQEPPSIEQEGAQAITLDTANSPRDVMLEVAYSESDDQITPMSQQPPASQSYIPGTPIPENVLFDAWDAFQHVVLPTLGEAMAVLGESTNITTPFVRELANIQTGLGTVAELGAKAKLVQIAAAAGGVPAIPVAGAVAAQTLITAPLSQVVAKDIEEGNWSQALEDILATGARTQEAVGRALEMEQVHWDRLVQHVGTPTMQAIESGGDIGQVARTFRQGVREMSLIEEGEWERRKDEGGDPGWFTNFISDVLGTPQLNVINKIPGVNKLIDAPFRAGANAIHGLAQTPRGYGVIMGATAGRGAADAMLQSASEDLATLWVSQSPDAGKAFWTRMEPHVMEVVENNTRRVPKTIDMSDMSLAEQNWIKMFERADMQGVHDLVRGLSTKSQDAPGFVMEMQEAVSRKVAANRSQMLEQSIAARDPLTRALWEVSKPVFKGYENIVGGVGTAMSVMWLVTASYLYGNPAESFIRTMAGGGKPGMMSGDRFKDFVAIFPKDSPIDLGDMATARTPWNAQRSSFLDKIPGMAWLEHQVLDKTNEWEVKIRRQAWSSWTMQAFEEGLQKSPAQFKDFMYNSVRNELGQLSNMLPAQYRESAMSTAYYAAAAGVPGLQAMKKKMIEGQPINQEIAEIAEKWQGFPDARDQVLRWLVDRGAPRKQIGTRSVSTDDSLVQTMEDLFIQQKETFVKRQKEFIADRAGWWETENVDVVKKDVADIARKYAIAPTGVKGDEARAALAAAVEKVTQLELGDAYMSQLRHQNNILDAAYYAGSGPGGSGGRVRQQIAENAAAAANDYLALATARNQQLMRELAPALEANGMGTVDDVMRSFVQYSDGLKGYYSRLAQATQDAWTMAREKKIAYSRLMDQITSNKSRVIDEEGDFLNRAQDFLDGVTGSRKMTASRLPKNMAEMVPDDYDSTGMVLNKDGIFRRGGSFDTATAQSWDDIEAMQEEIRKLVGVHPANNPEFINAATGAFDRLIEKFSLLPTNVQAYGGTLLSQASHDGGNMYRMNFPVYDDLNIGTYLAQTLFPFFRYEAFRFPYLARAAAHNPSITNAWFNYWEDSDQGYTKLPPFRTLQHLPMVGQEFAEGAWQWFPLGGTVFGGLRGVGRADFPPHGKVDQAAYDAVVNAPDLEPWEREWLKRPVLRDIVTARRLGKAFEAASQVEGQYGENPDVRGALGTATVAKRIAERYGFFPNMLVSGALDTAGGFAGESVGPIIKGGFNTLQQIPRDIPVLGGVGDIAYSVNKDLLGDSFTQNQVGHILADHGVNAKTATDEQLRAAWNQAARNELWADQIAGMRYRSTGEGSRTEYEQNRLDALENIFSVDERGARQKQAILDYTGQTKLKDAQNWLRARNEQLEDTLGKTDQSLALTDDQKEILRAIPGYENRREASAPFQSEDDKKVSEYYEDMRANKEAHDRAVKEIMSRNTDLPPTDPNYLPYSAAIKAIRAETSNLRVKNAGLNQLPKYADVQTLTSDMNKKNQLSMEDDLQREYIDVIHKSTSEAGLVNLDTMIKDQKQFMKDKRAQAEEALAAGNSEPMRAFRDFETKIQERRDAVLPGLHNATVAQEWLDAHVPRFKGVKAGDPLNDKIRDAIDAYKPYQQRYGAQGMLVMSRDAKKGRVSTENVRLAHLYRNQYDPIYTKVRRQLMNKNEDYRNIKNMSDDPDAYFQAVEANLNKKETAEDLLDRYRLLNQ